jgi:hypothetical protein
MNNNGGTHKNEFKLKYNNAKYATHDKKIKCINSN